jgi:hypothetical protein
MLIAILTAWGFGLAAYSKDNNDFRLLGKFLVHPEMFGVLKQYGVPDFVWGVLFKISTVLVLFLISWWLWPRNLHIKELNIHRKKIKPEPYDTSLLPQRREPMLNLVSNDSHRLTTPINQSLNATSLEPGLEHHTTHFPAQQFKKSAEKVQDMVHYQQNLSETTDWTEFPVAPWRRYFARSLDILILGLSTYFFLGLFGFLLIPVTTQDFFSKLNFLYASMLGAFFGFLVSGLILGLVGTTPGKAIFGIKVRMLNGQQLSVSNAISRDMKAYLVGCGLGIPFVSFITFILSYLRLKKYGATQWDEGRYLLTYKVNSWRQWILNILGIFLFLIAIVLIKLSDKL